MKTILLIEDHPEMRENTAEILELAGYDVVTAENGKVGVNKALEHLPDLIICDIMMPELDGYGTLRVLSRNPATAGIPFIFLTAKAEKSDWRKGMQLGADDYLTKPFEDSELLDIVELRLKKSEILQKEFPRDINGITTFINEARGRSALEALSKERESRVYRAKEIIFQENRHPYYLYFIQSGKVKTVKTNEDAKEYITGLYGKGDFLGYTALLQNAPYAESAVALEDSELLLIPKEDFLSLMYNNRDVAHKFIKLLSADIESKEEQLLHLAYDTIRKRVADALILLQERYQEEDQDIFKMPISRENLASIVGTSKECVIRVLSEFKQDGLIKTKQSEIQILKPEELSQIRY
ncbi:MAG: response regulator [Bacteroidetes bacterium]|nr:MAG: response regulator [Bacteroidota bacterium]